MACAWGWLRGTDQADGQMDGTDGMGRLAMWLRAGILPSIMREPSLPPVVASRGVETMFS